MSTSSKVSTESDSEIPNFKYKPLTKSNALRLLRLRPASHDNHDIDVELTEFNLSDSNDEPDEDNVPSYEAVSWCWGRQKQDQVLRIHEGDSVTAFNISPNLRSLLFALRKPNVVRHLWIDAIC